MVECLGEEALNDRDAVFVAGGSGDEGGWLGGREGPGTAEGFGEDGVGGVEKEGAEA